MVGIALSVFGVTLACPRTPRWTRVSSSEWPDTLVSDAGDTPVTESVARPVSMKVRYRMRRTASPREPRRCDSEASHPGVGSSVGSSAWLRVGKGHRFESSSGNAKYMAVSLVTVGLRARQKGSRRGRPRRGYAWRIEGGELDLRLRKLRELFVNRTGAVAVGEHFGDVVNRNAGSLEARSPRQHGLVAFDSVASARKHGKAISHLALHRPHVHENIALPGRSSPRDGQEDSALGADARRG